MDTIRNIFRIANLGTILFCVLNLALILFFFTNGYSDYTYMVPIIIIYIIVVLISISPIGEWTLLFLLGTKKIKRVDMKIRIIPLLEVVYNKAKKYSPKMVNSIRLRIINDPVPNAYAIGRKTICITDSIFQLSDDDIMGILAHEIGHLANRHSEIQLIIGGSNLFITGFLVLLSIISWIIKAIFVIFALESRSTVASIIVGIITAITTGFIWLWTKICTIFLRSSMRANEYVADEYAYKIGFGYQLASVLDKIHVSDPSSNGFFRVLNSTHPDYNDRIAKLQNLGVNYYG